MKTLDDGSIFCFALLCFALLCFALLGSIKKLAADELRAKQV